MLSHVASIEIECWGDGPDQSFYYTARPPGGQRSGPAPAFSDGTFRVPGQGAFGYAAELPAVLQDSRLTGLPRHPAVSSARRRLGTVAAGFESCHVSA